MTFNTEANAKFCLDFFRRLRRDHPQGNIVFSPLNMSAALHLLHCESQGDSPAKIEKVLHLTDEKEHVSPESRENSEETPNHNVSEDSPTAPFTNGLCEKDMITTEACEEYITNAEANQDGTETDLISTEAPEECFTDAEGNQDKTDTDLIISEAPEECITDAESNKDRRDTDLIISEAHEECITDAESNQDGTDLTSSEVPEECNTDTESNEDGTDLDFMSSEAPEEYYTDIESNQDGTDLDLMSSEAPEECLTDPESNQDRGDTEVMSTEAPEECLTDTESNQDGTDTEVMSIEAPEECFTDVESNQDGTDTDVMSTDAPEERLTDSESNQDRTAPVPSTSLEEVHEEKESPSVLNLLKSPETDAREIDTNLVHTSIPTDSQSTSDEGASASYLSGSENSHPEEGVGVLSYEQPSPEETASQNLVSTSDNQESLAADINSSAEVTKRASDNSHVDTENINNSSCVRPGNHVNPEGTATKKRSSSVVIHLVSESDNKKLGTETHSPQSREGTSPQSDIANDVPGRKDDKFLSQEQSSHTKSPESQRESMTFPDENPPSIDAHSEAKRDELLKHHFHKYKHNINSKGSKNNDIGNGNFPQGVLPSHEINEPMIDSTQTLENSSSRFDSDEDASSDFLPQSADYPEKEDEIMSQGLSPVEDNVFDNQINSPENKQVSVLNSSDTTDPPCSISGADGATMLNNGQVKKLNKNNEESEGAKEKALPDTKITKSQQCRTLGRRMGYSLSYVEFAMRSPYELPWYRHLLGRVWREVLRQACYQLLEDLTEPLENKMYRYIARMQSCPHASR